MLVFSRIKCLKSNLTFYKQRFLVALMYADSLMGTEFDESTSPDCELLFDVLINGTVGAKY